MNNKLKLLSTVLCMAVCTNSSYSMNVVGNPYINTQISFNTKFENSIKDAENATSKLLKNITAQLSKNNPMADYNSNANYNNQYKEIYSIISKLNYLFRCINENNTIKNMCNIEYYLSEINNIFKIYCPYIKNIVDAHKFVDNILHFSAIYTVINSSMLNSLQNNINALQSGINKYIKATNNIDQNIQNQLKRLCKLLKNLQDDMNYILKDKNLIQNLSTLNDIYEKFMALIINANADPVLTDNNILAAIRRPFTLFR